MGSKVVYVYWGLHAAFKELYT
jgi:hypothetical protein